MRVPGPPQHFKRSHDRPRRLLPAQEGGGVMKGPSSLMSLG